MAENLRFRVQLAEDCLEDAQTFYKSCGRVTSLHSRDILLFAYVGERTVGVVRLCLEHGFYVLRTMQVIEELQGKGIGRQILNRYKKLLDEQGISEVYCMPYAHLEDFYGLIEFKKIETNQAPAFLQQRVTDYYQKHPDKSVILMKKA